MLRPHRIIGFTIAAATLVLSSTATSLQQREDVQDEAVRLFREYLAIDTTNPQGDVAKAGAFYYKVLTEAGLDTEMIWTNQKEGKVNVLARLKGNGNKRPLLLLNHMDTVPFDLSRWSVDPLGAVMKDGYLYGRGALDMKNVGITQLMTMLELRRNRIKLERDVLFLGVADEEEGGRLGTAWIDQHRREDIDPEFVLDEGGFGTEGFFTEDGRLVFSVGVAEKRGNSLRLSVAGTPGHASMPPEDNANFILAKALGEIARFRTPEIITPITAEMIKRLGRLDRTPYTNALLRNTISLTIMRGFLGERGKSNVIPETAEAVLDCRLLPGQDPVAFAKQVESVINEPRVKVQRGSGEALEDVSSFDTDLFRIIEKETRKAYPESITLPHLVIYATDSRFFRRRGATCYGFFPGPVSMEEYKAIHGNDERIRVNSLRAAIPIYYNVVRSFCEVKK
jgi:acetylornithine deacetylase/succinyl-diaminopimelate desuccinylase-like protein